VTVLADVERLREALTGGNGGVAALLAEHPDPAVRLISQLWSHGAEEPEPVPEEGAVAVAARDELEEFARREQALRRKLFRLKAEHERLGEFTDVLAAALGACARCWGNDARCVICAGTGQPGSILPHRGLFARFVTPAVRRMAAVRGAQPASSPHHPKPPIDDRATTLERRPS
jgi:hypothetical protein